MAVSESNIGSFIRDGMVAPYSIRQKLLGIAAFVFNIDDS